MIISGFQNTTLLDYPGHVAATVFTGGCDFRCPFCHNGDIVLDVKNQYDVSEILAFLRKRKNVLEGVCVTGGEPTLQKDIAEFLYHIKNIGLKVKLDTNGNNPRMLERLIEGHLVDYIAMDIKSSLEKYAVAIGIKDFDTDNIKESVDIIMKSGLDYEFRTTIVKGVHEKADIVEAAKLIANAKAYYLQSYKENENTIFNMLKKENIYGSFNKQDLLDILESVKEYVPNTQLRGID